MAQSDDKASKKEERELQRENRRLEAEVKNLKDELKAANTRIKKLEQEMETAAEKFSTLIRSRRVTTDPGAGTPVSCIEDIGGDPNATTYTKQGRK